MKQTIYQVYSFESDEWVDCDKHTWDRTEDKYRKAVDVVVFRQPNRLDLMSKAEQGITIAMYLVEESGASEHLTNAVIKLSQARDLVYEHYRTIDTFDRTSVVKNGDCNLK